MKKRGIVEKAVEMQGDMTEADRRMPVPTARGAARVNSVREIAKLDVGELLSPEELAATGLMSTTNVDRQVRDAFRGLRQSLIELEPRDGRRSPILLISPISPCMSSQFVSKNLAASIAMDDARTSLLIDCDIEKSRIESYEVGLLNYLSDEKVSTVDILQSAGVPRMRVIDTGQSANEAIDIFHSARMYELMDDVACRYEERFIVINGSNNLADLAQLSAICDAMLLVVSYGRATDSRVLKALRSIDADKMLGFIMDDIPPWQMFAA